MTRFFMYNILYPNNQAIAINKPKIQPKIGLNINRQMFFNSNSIVNRIQNIKPGCSSCGK